MHRKVLSVLLFLIPCFILAQDIPVNAWPSIAPRDPLHHDYTLKPRESVVSFQYSTITWPSSPTRNRIPSAAFLWNPTHGKRWTFGLITKNDFQYLRNINEGYAAILFNFFRKDYRSLTAGIYAGVLNCVYKNEHLSPAIPNGSFKNRALNFHFSLAYTRSWISTSIMRQNVTQPSIAVESYGRYPAVTDVSIRLNLLRDKKTGLLPFSDFSMSQHYLKSMFTGLYVRRNGMLYGLAFGNYKRMRAGIGIVAGRVNCSFWLQGLLDQSDNSIHKEFAFINLLIKTGGK
ncbi:MAG: hypothetical protein V2A54_11275 [Bacteroidota bacterium]